MPGENPPGADGPAPIVFYGAANAICLSLVLRINAVVPTWEPVGWLDDDPGRQGSEFWGLPILGGGELLPELASRPGIHVFNNVRGHWSRNERVAERIDRAALPTASLIHPTFNSWGIELGRGLFITSGVVPAENSRFGDHVTMFGNVVLGHDVTVGDFTLIAQLSSIGSGCSIGRRCFLGAGCIVLPGVSIGDEVVVAAGAVVTRDVPPGSTVMGMPARRVEHPADDGG
jgi:sugar O-acyltransferase (sialic acid O-acetyltransferase NeuD family)